MTKKDHLSNYGVMIPQGPYLEPKKSDAKKWLCKFIGHRWQSMMVTTTDRTLPEECVRCHKERWLGYNHWRKRLSRGMARLGRMVDTLLRPLCFFNLHRWKGTFREASYGYPGGIREEKEHFRCCRCKKNKTVLIS